MQPTILLYDSGMGGLTVYDEIRKALPNARYLYCFDNAFFPYSEKAESVLIERAVQIVQKISENYPLDLVVVACNTASTVVLPALRENFGFPIVGTVPAIKPAAVISESKTIGLLATKGTVVRPYVLDLIEKYASDCVVEKIGTTDLVEIVEEKQRTGEVDMARLQRVIAEWQNHPTLDTVILGCTHFPTVRDELKQLLPNVKFFVDSGEAIAKRVANLLADHHHTQSHHTAHLAFCTAPTDDLAQRSEVMRKWGFETLAVLAI
ncbi:glutamate racemase [Haemophilus paracuniculus]|uniref:Glutamate racemase n=1 Tax=Haemophilus paracuniculus TaxID=734 RepID=A0A1T0APJ5_9PAST|nr:glutamate racemase [Haemophilus paracuniculus]OOR98088.1 glutamate racemase [Haemophilus paracuniculus]